MQQPAAVALVGDPVLLWVGHLDANKDPLTVFKGIATSAQALPNLRMYCCFGTAPLMTAVRRFLHTDPQLRGRVQLLGTVAHNEIERLMQAADFFVLGSHREGSGYSLIEALACGLPPIVTDIPSFRSITGAGKVGALWTTGDARQLSSCLASMTARSWPEMRAQTRTHFERELSIGALGRKLLLAYQDQLEQRPRLHAQRALREDRYA